MMDEKDGFIDVDELSPIGIVKLIDLTISCSLHRLSYDEGGFVSGWDNFYSFREKY